MKIRGGIWRNEPAVANALVKAGHVIGYEVVGGGAGYTSPPTVQVPGIKDVAATVKLSFSQKFESNGSVSAIAISPKPK